MKEHELQELVVNDIRQNMFYEKIKKKTYHIKNKKDNGDFFNHLISDRYWNGIKKILISLEGDIELINVDDQNRIKSISLDNQHLFPDILAMSGETDDYLIIELKTSDKTERETITELYSYEQELINHLPMLERGNINKIIIATSYKPMLRHSLSNALLHGDNILCLKPQICKEEIVTYEIVDVSEWTMLNYDIPDDLSKGIFNGICLCFYKRNDSIILNDEIVTRDMKFFIDMLKDFESISGGNGFCIIWKAHVTKNKINIMTTDYIIMLFTVNPYYIAIKDVYKREDALSLYIYNNIHRQDRLEDGGQEFKKSFESLKEHFSKKYNIYMETPNNLYTLLMSFKKYHIVDIDAWGELGFELKRLYFNKSYFCEENLAFNNPDVFFKLIVYLTENYPFRIVVGKGEAFHLGIYIGILLELCKTNQWDTIIKNEIRHIWKYVFCSIEKIFPRMVDATLVAVNKRITHKIIKLIERFMKRIDEKYPSYHIELKNGMKYYYFSWELRGYTIIKEFVKWNAMSFEEEELAKDNEAIEGLLNVFSITYKCFVGKFIENSSFREKSFNIMRDIINICRVTNNSLDSEEEVLRLFREKQVDVCLRNLDGYEMMFYLRKMLNLI